MSGIWPPDVGGPASHAPDVADFLHGRGHGVEVVTTARGVPPRARYRVCWTSRQLPKGVLHLRAADFKVLEPVREVLPSVVETILAVCYDRELFQLPLSMLQVPPHIGGACSKSIILPQATLLVLLSTSAGARIVAACIHRFILGVS